MELQDWLLGEIDSIDARLRGQVHDVVPADAQRSRVGEGNSITWSTFHVAKHAALALRVLGHLPLADEPRLANFPEVARRVDEGLQEVEQPWAAELDTGDVRQFSEAVIGDVRAYLGRVAPDDLDRELPVRAQLASAGVDNDRFGWLYAMWSAEPAAFLVRWPLLGHITNHVGEMISTRNQLGFSPFR